MRGLEVQILLASLCALYSCDFPLDGSRYVVGDDGELTSDLAATPTDLTASFAREDADCEACISESCASQAEECLETEGCFDFTNCALETPDPAAIARCMNQADASREAFQAFVGLRECYQTCVAACPVGNDWSCVEDYDVPTPPSDELRIQQTFEHLFEGGPVSNATVRYCAFPDACEENAPTAVTDEQGTYALNVPVKQKPLSLAGWGGVRRVTGDSIFPHVLARNIPYWADHSDHTFLLPLAYGDILRNWLGSLGGLEASEVFAIHVQVFDCLMVGSGDAVIEVPTAADPFIVYPKGSTEFALDHTQVTGEGAALVTRLETGMHHTVIAKHSESGEILAEGSVYVSSEEIASIHLFPTP